MKEPMMPDIKKDIEDLKRPEFEELMRSHSLWWTDRQTVSTLTLLDGKVIPPDVMAQFTQLADCLRQYDPSVGITIEYGSPSITRQITTSEIKDKIANTIYWRRRDEYSKWKKEQDKKEQEANMPRGTSPHLTPSSTPSVS